METFLGVVFGTIISAVLASVAIGVRARRALARSDAMGSSVRTPVWVRGAVPRYPGYWRAGLLDPATGVFEPRGWWGHRLALAAASIVEIRAGSAQDKLPLSAQRDTVITSHDVDGQPFQIVAFPTDAARLESCLVGWAHEADARPVALRWLRTRLPFFVVVILVITVSTSVVFAPWSGVRVAEIEPQLSFIVFGLIPLLVALSILATYTRDHRSWLRRHRTARGAR